MTVNISLEKLKKIGWYETKTHNIGTFENELISLGKILGNPVKQRKSEGLAQKLVPTASENSFINSLSFKYAKNEFPLHVDTAHWIIPCKYIILGCIHEGESNRNTLLADYSKLEITKYERELLFNEPFKISNGKRSFYGSILSKDREFIRYDPGCMTPVTDPGHKVGSIFSNDRVKHTLKKITWEVGKIVVIDNWRILHGRGRIMNDGCDRVLYRVLVE